MTDTMNDIMHPGGESGSNPDFPNSPDGWTRETAADRASQEGLEPGDDHWAVVRALQEYNARHAEGGINVRELHDALDEKFHDRGGMKYLYELFPGGPISQGCRLAGIEAPPGSTDTGFGSVR